MTIDNPEGERLDVSAEGKDYAAAYEAARQLIPEGWRAIAIRTTN